MRWVRFAPTREMGFLSSRRYILPWVRFAPTHEIGFVRASRLWTRSGGGETARTRFFSPDSPECGGFVSRRRVRWGSAPHAVTSCRGFVSRRRMRLGSFGRVGCGPAREAEKPPAPDFFPLIPQTAVGSF